MTYATYSDNVSKVMVEYKHFVEKHPHSKLAKRPGEILDCHIDAKELWRRAIMDNKTFISGSMQMVIGAKYQQ